MARRVVITGMGAITPIGDGDAFWKAAKAGVCGIGPISNFDTTDFKVKIAAQCVDFDPTQYIEKREARRMDRFCQLAIAAADICMKDSSLGEVSPAELERFGVIIGSGVGGLKTTETEHSRLLSEGPGRVSPLMVPMIIVNMAAGNISLRYGLRGHCSSVVTACASGTSAIGEAMRAIKFGFADRMIAGGAEGVITPLTVAGFTNITALTLSSDPKRASIPFDLERSGFVMGEGAGALLLEEYEMAKARGAHIYAEVLGYGSTGDAYHMTAPDPEGAGAARSMTLALEEGGVRPNQVGYINAHGTSTPPNDRMETMAIKRAFEGHACKLAVSSSKSMFGHMLGAAGAVEGIITAHALEEGYLPPTIGYKTPDPECDLDYVPNVGREAKINFALSNSFGFGGHNASILLGRV